MNKYCRICWNTASWRGPTGEASRLEMGKSYVCQNGFGHEEWLFNFSWLQPGPKGTSGKFRYASLQPIGKYREKYEDQTFDVLLYTVTPDKHRMAVAIVKQLYVPRQDELEEAREYMRRHGWLAEMEKELASLGLSSKGLKGTADHVINVRFRRTSVRFFEPDTILPKNHVTYRIDRYQPLDWVGDAPPEADDDSKETAKDGKRRSEEDITRAAMERTIYSPAHVRLQNALHGYLCRTYGKKAVHYERSRIDLELEPDKKGIRTLFEIKMALTAKSCIRQAIGQLLEYDIYPNRKRHSRLIVVGEESCNADDDAYLKYLREKFGVPIYYARWNWEHSKLEGFLANGKFKQA